jgi:hypothetical protein
MDRAFTLHITIGNFDEVLKDYVVPMAGPRISQIKARRVARHRLAQRYAAT